MIFVSEESVHIPEDVDKPFNRPLTINAYMIDKCGR